MQPTALQGQQAYDAQQAASTASGRFVNAAAVQPQQQSIPSPYNPPASVSSANTTSPATTTLPVVTAQAAQNDYQNKLNVFNSLQSQVAQQKSVLAQQAAQRAADGAQKDLQDSENNLKQQGLDIQKQQADTAQQTAQAKMAAVQSLNTPTNQTQQNQSSQTGQVAPQPPDLNSLPGTNAQSLLSSESSALSGIQSAKDENLSNLQSQVQSVMTGTFPLSSTEQSLITGIQNSLASNVAFQQTANQANVGAVEESSFRSGGEYTPAIAAGTLANTISTGIQKIQALDNDAASTMAQLEQGFQQQDYTMVNGLYDRLDKSLSDKSTSIKDLFDTAIQSEQQNRAYNLQIAQDNFSDTMESANFSATQKKTAFDESMQSAQFNEEQKKDMAEMYNQSVSRAISEFQAGIPTGSTFDQTTGQFIMPNGSSTTYSPQNMLGYTTLSNGSGVVDLGNVPDSQQTAIQTMAKNSGVIVIPKQNSASVTSLNTISSTFQRLQQDFTANNSGNDEAASSRYQSALASLQSQIKADPKLSSINTNALPSLGFFFPSVGDQSSKFASFQDNVNETYASLIPGYTPPVFGQTFKSPQDAQKWAVSSGQQKALNNLVASYPDASAAQLLKLINGQ